MFYWGINFRIENNITADHAFGITLDSIDIYTANDKWDKAFIDRTIKENQNLSMRKILKL